MNNNGLIGYTGFVGSNLDNQSTFDCKYNSKNINEIQGKEFDTLVCAGVKAVKWWANKNPAEDLEGINSLLENLKKVKAKRFILISTVDVYPSPINVDEDTLIEGLENHAYGKHRLYLEKELQKIFPSIHIIRLPGLFGEGLKKNVVYDLLTDNMLENINPMGEFQYYYLDNLWGDIQKVIKNEIPLINFSTEPLLTQTIIDTYFPEKKEITFNNSGSIKYQIKTKFSDIWGKNDGYLYSKEDILEQLNTFIKKYKSNV